VNGQLLSGHVWQLLMQIAGNPSSEWRRAWTKNSSVDDIAGFASSHIIEPFFWEGMTREQSLRSDSVWNRILERGRLALRDAALWSFGWSHSDERRALLFLLLMRHPAEMLNPLSIEELRAVFRIVMIRPALDWDGVVAAMKNDIDIELLRML
jgi:hypothetical protein